MKQTLFVPKKNQTSNGLALVPLFRDGDYFMELKRKIQKTARFLESALVALKSHTVMICCLYHQHFVWHSISPMIFFKTPAVNWNHEYKIPLRRKKL